jgi:hypothetical protein
MDGTQATVAKDKSTAANQVKANTCLPTLRWMPSLTGEELNVATSVGKTTVLVMAATVENSVARTLRTVARKEPARDLVASKPTIRVRIVAANAAGYATHKSFDASL